MDQDIEIVIIDNAINIVGVADSTHFVTVEHSDTSTLSVSNPVFVVSVSEQGPGGPLL